MTVPQRAACDVQLAACTDELCATQPCTTIYHDARCAKRSDWLDRLLPPDRDDARRGSPAERKRSLSWVSGSARHESWPRLGVVAGLLGLEHGYFETLQGNAAPSAALISAIGPPCQPETAWHACEPAFTLVPSFFVTGLLAMIVAVVVLIWAAVFVQRDHGGIVLLVLTVFLFLVGGGFYILWFGVVAGIAGTKIGAPLTWWRVHLPAGMARVLVRLWPWVLILYLVWVAASWFIGSAFGELMLRLTPLVTAATPVLLVLILLTSFACDTRTEAETR